MIISLYGLFKLLGYKISSEVGCLLGKTFGPFLRSKKIIEMVKHCGAKKVYFASASPPIRYQNIYGIDMPATKELIAHKRSIRQIKNRIGADELIYQELEDLKQSATAGNRKIKSFEDSVFSGSYCTGNVTKEFLTDLEDSRTDANRR